MSKSLSFIFCPLYHAPDKKLDDKPQDFPKHNSVLYFRLHFNVSVNPPFAIQSVQLEILSFCTLPSTGCPKIIFCRQQRHLVPNY